MQLWCWSKEDHESKTKGLQHKRQQVSNITDSLPYIPQMFCRLSVMLEEKKLEEALGLGEEGRKEGKFWSQLRFAVADGEQRAAEVVSKSQ